MERCLCTNNDEKEKKAVVIIIITAKIRIVEMYMTDVAKENCGKQVKNDIHTYLYITYEQRHTARHRRLFFFRSV